MAKMKAERITRRHTPLPNAATRSSNRIRAKKKSNGTKQAGLSQEQVSSESLEPTSSQETLNNSIDVSDQNNFSSFSSYNTDDSHSAEQIEGTLTIAHRNPQLNGTGVTPSNTFDNKAGPGTAQLTAGEIALDIYGSKILIDSTLGKKLAGEVALRAIRQRRSDMILNMERRSNVEAFLAHLTGVQVKRSCKNCSKGHGPWSECIIYDGQMCGSCTNCWFNASGSRCTFHENNQNSIYAPLPMYHPQSAGMPTQPIQYTHINPQAVPQGIAMNPPTSIQGEATTTLYNLPGSANNVVGNVISTVAAMNQGERVFARVERAAEDLGLRIAELHEFLATPEGNAFVTQLSGIAAPQQIASGDNPSQERSQENGQDNASQEPLFQEPSSQNNAHQELASQDTSSHGPSSQESSSQEQPLRETSPQQTSSQERFSQGNVEAHLTAQALTSDPPLEN
ncbi:uncharacterized protein BKA55DRAFT_595831 [Fusarium redolens]|uniref:Uncharacterized protein n=1 Tax=Fusarium redolens TaxID=48865 RepID=A0A9P9GQD3_FUSRE|nr:uncharacterized protein BKA55DRAFT_595831 [Fusarium redolens]KAH7243391.1 hypothetical protein BKA55DRAFT_595831 [Fusarium redolens]